MNKKKYFISNINHFKNKTKSYKHKQYGGNLDISGPVKIGYFVSDKFNKKIIVISDIHGEYKGSCDDQSSLSITNYIESIITDYPIDIFIETDIPNHQFLSNPSDKYLKLIIPKIPNKKDFIGDLVDFSYKNYKLNPNKRFHFIDIRYDINGQDIYRNIEKVITMIKSGIIKIKDDNLSEVIHELITDYVFAFINIIQWISEPNFDDIQRIIPYYFYKEFELLSKSNPKEIDSMVEILKSNIKNFIYNYF